MFYESKNIKIINGDCSEILPTLPDASCDVVFCDPPYPCIRREYGTMNEDDWLEMMKGVMKHCKRIVKSTGSAVFILQPNSEIVGKMRLWIWEFLLWGAKEWNLIQDVYWWNNTTPPNVHCWRKFGLMRPSVKMCVWFGDSKCYRNQDEVLLPISDGLLKETKEELEYLPSGQSMRRGRCARVAIERGGSTPFNLLTISGSDSTNSAGAYGHCAGTPNKLTDWWLRYICPPGGVVLDPFLGSGTTALTCLKQGKSCVGIEKETKYCEIAKQRIASHD